MLRLSAHLGYLFTELPLEQRLGAASEAGFTLIEHPNPYAIPARQLDKLCLQHDLNFVQLALPSGDPGRGEKGLACLPDRRAAFERSIDTGLSYARAVGARFIHVMAGVTPPDPRPEELWEHYIDSLQLACRAAAQTPIGVLIEPIGPATLPGYYLSDPYDALRAIKDVGASNLFMLFDAFHAVCAGVEPVNFVREHKAHIRHVHIADHPGRHEPGTGSIPFGALFEELFAGGYDGAIGLEYIPKTSTVEGLGWRCGYT